MTLDTMGGRRFIFACAGLLAATALQAAGRLDASGATYAAIVICLAGIFTTGNVTQRHIDAKKDKP